HFLPSAGQRDIEQPALVSIGKIITRQRKRIVEVQLLFLGWKLPFIDAQYYHVVCLFAFAGMAGHKTNIKLREALNPIVTQIGLVVMVTPKQQNRFVAFTLTIQLIKDLFY